MSKLKEYTYEEIKPVYADLNPDFNKYKTETAGFVPLEVKFKRFEEDGLVAQFNSSDFTSTDYRDIYLNPDFEITPEDDYEDIQEKLQLREQYISKLKAAKSNGHDEMAGTVEPEKKAAEAAEAVEKQSE